MLIDTHAHLYAQELADRIDEILSDAITDDIEKIYLPNIDLSSIDDMHALADRYPDHCFPMMGLHPCYVKEDYKDQLAQIYAYHKSERTYWGVGEMGLDYYWDLTFKKEQVDAFEQQIGWGLEFNLPLIIHSRDSLDDTISIVTHHQTGDLQGIFHCFNGTIEQAKKALDSGFYLGLGGVITFKNAKLDDMVSYLPKDRILLETDSPYLSPHPHRGKKNESKYIKIIAEKLAQIRGETLSQVAEYTTQNAQLLFG